MGEIHKDVFICLDCEATGLDIDKDRIIELAAIRFNFQKNLDSFETLINPQTEISLSSQAIHNITTEMVRNQPTIDLILPKFFEFIDNFIIVGHGIEFDINILFQEARRHSISCSLHNCRYIDTLRLARLYGESPTNSLENLRKHFNIQPEGAHRAMNDVIVNIEVFKHLSLEFKTTEALLTRLKKPIILKAMPLGKHKGRKFTEIPIEYLNWASYQNFDQDLLFSIRTEINHRKKQNSFHQASNPFSNL